MSDDVKSASLRAFRSLLRPVVRILLRGGVTWKEAAEACKATFVEVATEDFGLHGRPTSISRVAILTGLGRREVSRVRQLIKSEQPPELGRMNAATRVLSGWYLDREFLDGDGQPRQLPFQGEGPSFTSLARRYGGDIAVITMLHELHRVGAIEERPDGRLKVLKRYYMPALMDPAATMQAGSMLQDLGNTAHYNLVRPAETESRFLGRATNPRIRSADVAPFREFLEAEGQALLERADAWLSKREVSEDSPRRYRVMRLGVGVFQIQDD
jgi:hypothetical protein